MEEFLFTNAEPSGRRELFYRVNRAGTGRTAGDFDIVRSSSYPYCVIHFVEEGSGFVICRGKKHPVGPGQLFVLAAHEGHRYLTVSDNPFLLHWIEFSGGDSNSLVGAFLDSHSPVVDAPHSLAVDRRMLRIFSLLEMNPCVRTGSVSKLLYAILITLLDLCREENSKLSRSEQPEMEKVLRHIDAHLQEGLEVSGLAGLANFNPQYFSRLFRKHIGMPPVKYIAARRIHRAKELLSGSTVPVEQLAEQLGFCSASHFIRLFKKAEGLTPAEFRRQSSMYLRREL